MRMRSYLSKLFPFILIVTGSVGCQTNTVKDMDGNKYKTVKIGTQVWMSENLKTTRYNDGTAIPVVQKYDDWAALTTPACCWYGNDSTWKELYGALYNWYAVNTNKLCPDGWHVPTDEEWNELRDCLGNNGNAGDALKESGTIHWRSPNSDATNSSGFNALPGGYRDMNGPFNLIRADGYWWSSTESSWYVPPGSQSTISFYRNLQYDNHDLYRNVADKSFGFCVRCLRNEEEEKDSD